MNDKKWISLMVVAVMSFTMFCGCKKQPAEEEAVADHWVVTETDDAQEPDKETTPTDKEQKEQNNTPSKEEQTDDTPTQEKPSEDPPAQETPDEEDTPNQEPSKDDEPSSGEEEPEPIEKESSGTAITLLSQNVKHAGVRLGTKGDGTGNDIYNRLRRFKALVQNHDPDVIFFQEARIGTIQFFTVDDPYFTQTYTTLWKWRWEDLGAYNGGHQAEPLLYKTAKYTCLDSGFFWLSYTPWQPSKCYDVKADYGNIASWAILQDKETGDKFYVCSAHSADPTDGGGNAYILCMEQFWEELRELKDDEYGFIGGDFNIKYRSEAYKLAWDWDTIVDLQDMAKNMNVDALCELGDMNGSSNWGYNTDVIDTEPGHNSQRDHIVAKLHPNMAVDYYGFDYTRYDYPPDDVKEGHISDHYGIICKVRINTDVDYSRYQVPYDE